MSTPAAAGLRCSTLLRLSSIRRSLTGPGYHSTRNLSTRTATPPRSLVWTGLYSTAVAVSVGLSAIYYFDARSAIHRYLLTPVLRQTLDPETSHKFALKVLRSGLAPRDPLPDDERLKCRLWDEELSNPVGLAAGFDKDGEVVDGLFNLGFSWVEIGSVTPKPQTGNPKPRLFHLPDDSAVINCYGFPSQGHTSVLARLRARIPPFLPAGTSQPASFRYGSLLAVNLGKNKGSPVDSIDDYVAGVRAFGPYADVLVVNISSPNTPGLRGMQNRKVLDELLAGVADARDGLVSAKSVTRKPKLVLKIAPDLDEAQILDIADAVKNSHVDGVIVSNTTVQRPSTLTDPNKFATGGLSGAPLKHYALATLRTLRKHLPASIPLIGCGGISSGADALEFAQAGASFVQVYTAFGYGGVGTCRRIKDELVKALEKQGTTWHEIVAKAMPQSDRKAIVTPSEEGSVGQLIAEALELKGRLDRLEKQMQEEEIGKEPRFDNVDVAVADPNLVFSQAHVAQSIQTHSAHLIGDDATRLAMKPIPLSSVRLENDDHDHHYQSSSS